MVGPNVEQSSNDASRSTNDDGKPSTDGNVCISNRIEINRQIGHNLSPKIRRWSNKFCRARCRLTCPFLKTFKKCLPTDFQEEDFREANKFL